MPTPHPSESFESRKPDGIFFFRIGYRQSKERSTEPKHRNLFHKSFTQEGKSTIARAALYIYMIKDRSSSSSLPKPKNIPWKHSLLVRFTCTYLLLFLTFFLSILSPPHCHQASPLERLPRVLWGESAITTLEANPLTSGLPSQAADSTSSQAFEVLSWGNPWMKWALSGIL